LNMEFASTGRMETAAANSANIYMKIFLIRESIKTNKTSIADFLQEVIVVLDQDVNFSI